MGSWTEFFSGLTACLVVVLPLLVRLWLELRKEKSAADALSEAIDQPEPKAAIRKATTHNADLARHLDAVRERPKTKRIDPKEGE